MAVSTIRDLQELPAVLSMRDVQRTLGVAKKTAYDLAHRADFPTIRLGRTIRVTREAFIRWMEKQAGAEGEQ